MNLQNEGLPISPITFNPADLLTKTKEVKVNYEGKEYGIIYKKDHNISLIMIDSISTNEAENAGKNIQGKAFNVDDMVKAAQENKESLATTIFKQILENESTIVLGLTDIGYMDPHDKWRTTTAKNIDTFSATLAIENYQTWSEIEKWDEGGVDWKDVIYPRLDIIRKSPEGKIHFNITGMTKEDIQKSLTLKHDVITGETGKIWGTKTGMPPTGSWKDQFGHFGLTYWELMQVVHDPVLLKKTEFYVYESEQTAAPLHLNNTLLKIDYGLDLASFENK